MDRRSLLTTALAAGTAACLPRRLVAEVPAGAGTLQTVSDGNLVLPRDFVLGGLPEADLAPILAAHGVSGDTLTPPCNVTLYRDAERVVLFDCGAGSDFMPSAGALADNLDAIDLAPEDVTHVVFTHAHPDHIWGLLDDFDDPAFPGARYLIGQTELDYWTDPATVDEIGAARQSFAVGAARRLARIAEDTETFGDGDEILPGIAARATYGHTPGHMAFEIGGSDGVTVVGDAIGNPHVAFARPGWETGSDQDPPRAAATRKVLLDRLAAERSLIVGFHLPGGGIGRVARDGGAYRFEPEPG